MNDICPYLCYFRSNSGYCSRTGGYDSCEYRKMPTNGEDTIYGFSHEIIPVDPEEIANLLCEAIRLKKELDEYTTAKREGRLLILPCKVGDTVYRICHEYKKGNPFIRAVTFNQNNFWRIVFGGEFGKTVFLTRAEAEAALNGGKPNG